MTTTCIVLSGFLFCYTIPPAPVYPYPTYTPPTPYYQPYPLPVIQPDTDTDGD